MSSGGLLRAHSISADIQEMARMQERAMQNSLRDVEWQMRLMPSAPGNARPPLPPPPVPPSSAASAALAGEPPAAPAASSPSVSAASASTSLAATSSPQVADSLDDRRSALAIQAAQAARAAQAAHAAQAAQAAHAAQAAQAVHAARAASAAAAAAFCSLPPDALHASLGGTASGVHYAASSALPFGAAPNLGFTHSLTPAMAQASLPSAAMQPVIMPAGVVPPPAQTLVQIQPKEEPKDHPSPSTTPEDMSHDEMLDEAYADEGTDTQARGGGSTRARPRSRRFAGDSAAATGAPRKVIRRHRMTKEEEARFSAEQLRDLQGTTAAKSRKMSASEHDVMLHKRRLRNRQSAARSRDKQRRTIADVGKEVDDLLVTTAAMARRVTAAEATTALVTAQNAELASQLVSIRAENEMLRKEAAVLRNAPASSNTAQLAVSSGISQPIKMLRRASSSLHLSLSSADLLDKVAMSAGNCLARVASVSNLGGLGAGSGAGFHSALAFSPQRPLGGENASGLGRPPSSIPFTMSSDKLDSNSGFPPLPRNFSFFERFFDGSVGGGSVRPPAITEG